MPTKTSADIFIVRDLDSMGRCGLGFSGATVHPKPPIRWIHCDLLPITYDL